MALAVSAVALVAAVAGLVAIDVIRFRQSAQDDAHALAQVIARNAAAAIVFNDAEAARQILASVQVRPVVSLACLYRADGSQLASFSRGASCPASPHDVAGWRLTASVVPVQRNDRVVGAAYVERQLSDLPARVFVTAGAGAMMLLLAAGVAFGVARRMQQAISRPIVSLAHAANEIGRDPSFVMPKINAPPDEIGALVQAFGAMVDRLVSANQALTQEVAERTRMQAEREALLAREREASRLKDEFLAAVSHELRTPLNAIMGWTQMLSTMPPNDQTLAKAIASLSRNAEAQKRVIEDLLDVSRIITGKLHLQLAAVDLRTAIESAVDVIAPIAATKRIALDVALPPQPCLVEADLDRIRQVLWNVLSNAVKFTQAGGTVRVRLSEHESAVSMSISDTGIGIASAFLPHVFERFRQADGSTTREHGGLGLGLALVKELVELHGGAVAAASDGLGKGATFTITLPMLLPGARTTEPTREPAPAVELPMLTGVNVLAVDDNADSLDIVNEALSAAGATVRTALSAADALREFQRQTPDVVLCDLAMPGIDGLDFLALIHAEDRASGRRPTAAIALTAYVSDEYRERCRVAGFSGYVAKPFTARVLIRELSAVLARQ